MVQKEMKNGGEGKQNKTKATPHNWPDSHEVRLLVYSLISCFLYLLFFYAVTVVSSLLYESLPCKINSFNAIGIFFLLLCISAPAMSRRVRRRRNGIFRGPSNEKLKNRKQ